nr:MAG TPA: hypothetical protein [Caudoviricetes sp.]
MKQWSNLYYHDYILLFRMNLYHDCLNHVI